ncbi:MAG: CaiB/BaiF CoA-transferase family protein, partial [Pseudomonadota bacterium]
MSARGPLHDVRVLELAGLGPVPFAGMMFADMGADVILIDRRNTNPNQAETTTATSGASALYNRGKRSIAVDLKAEGAKQAVLKLVETADLLIEGYRPGVMERLGLGPEVCHGVNPGLVYGRMTGWGQSGPLAQAAGHDINYIALAGALYYAGADDAMPFTPPTLVGDVAGGAMSLAFGMMAALHRVRAGEPGQVVDAAICDGTAYLTSLMYAAQKGGLLSDDKTENFLTGASPWYNTYLCKDGKHITVGALEPSFY